MSDDEGIEIQAVRRVASGAAKNANVKRILQRLLMATREESGRDRIVAVFAVTLTEGKDAGLAYALTWEEAPTLAKAVDVGLERALSVLRAAATKPKPT